jgi:hypothetical protein
MRPPTLWVALPSRVERTVIACREHGENHEIDVAVTGISPNKATESSLWERGSGDRMR